MSSPIEHTIFTPVPSCQHRHKADEAFHVDMVTGEERPTVVYLCDWPDSHPENFVDAPRWLQRCVYPGLAIAPELDCINCPARLP